MAHSDRQWPTCSPLAPHRTLFQSFWTSVNTAAHWKKIGKKPHHGINVPLFSLRSARSCGIGEFTDLIGLIDWCKQVHFDCIQLLPLNDTGDDPSPYNPLSSCALDPIYLALRDLPDAGPLLFELDLFTPLIQAPRVLRREVKKRKIGWLKRYFQRTFTAVSKEKAYRDFIENNQWLEPYATFLLLKEVFGQKSWTEWPSSYEKFPREQIDFHLFCQFHCYQQLKKVREHADAQQIFLKGDIPILIGFESADVWAEKQLFQLDYGAGAPPDQYNPKGQYWGFPLFNWTAIRQSGFSWWHRRLKVAEQFFHLYRIDHVVGFFRIWGIPRGNTALPASFFPPERSLWAHQGKELLEMLLQSTSMLPLAEDLGTIPEEVYPLLKQLGICGTKVVRWQRYPDGSYIPFDQYERLSVTTLSTHDMDPLEAWWFNAPAESVPFAQFKQWPFHPILRKEQRLELLYDAHHTSSLFHINLLQEYLALFDELSWPNPQEERINYPGVEHSQNWTYRFRPFLEEFFEHSRLQRAVKNILTQGG